jgi:hypothetical protein
MALVLLVLAVVLVALEAFRVSTPWVSLGWLGLAIYLLLQVLGQAGAF